MTYRARLLLSSVIATTLFASTLASAQTTPPSALPTQVRYAQLLTQVSATSQRSVALAKLYAANRLRLHVPTAKAAAILQKTIDATKDPLVKAALVRTRVLVLQDLGDTTQGPRGQKGPMRKLGCLTDFSVVGPFENASMEAFESTLAPETGEAGPYKGKTRQIDWRPLPDYSNRCTLNLSRSIAPAGDAVVFLANSIKSPKKQKVKLMLGASGHYRVWLNGKPVALRKDNTGLALDNDAWAMTLERGDNTLLIKMGSDQISGLNLIARLVDNNLQPVTNVSMTAKWSGKPVVAIAPENTPKADPAGVLSQTQTFAKTATGSDALWNAWIWRLIERRNVGTPWRDVATKIRSQVDDGKLNLAPEEHIFLAKLFEEHWERVGILSKLHKAHPKNPWVAIELAHQYENSLSDTQRLAIKPLLMETLKHNPWFLPAAMGLSDWYEGRSFHVKALRVLQKYKNATTLQSPRFGMEMVNALKTYGSRKEADALRLKVYQQARLSSGYTWRYLRQHLMRQEYDKALAIIQNMRATYPGSSTWLAEHVTVLHSQKKTAEAVRLLDAQIKNQPGNVYLLKKKADLLIAMSKKEDAAKVLDQALSYRPQDKEIRDQLSHLRPQANRFHEAWMVEDVRKVAKQIPAGQFHTTKIIDQSVTQVSTNGLAQTVSQVAERANTKRGLDSAKYHRIYFQGGDEQVDILRVRVYKKDGSISEDYNKWTNSGSRKGSTTYNDNGTVTVRANNVDIGDIVEVRYRLSQVANQNFRGDYFGDISYLQGTVPIGLMRYTILYPDSWNLYFRKPKLKHTRLDNTSPDGKAVQKGFKSTSFELRNVPDVKTDANQPGYTSVYDYLLVSNKKNYDEIGSWWWNLVKGQLIVDDNIKNKVKALVKGLKTEDQKIAAIHNYVVQNTRYLHVGLGIHGWKPYRTTTCFRNRFGDCKDKASLLKVMLEQAGIKANLVLVRTRRLGKVEDYPASMHIFNHAITYVPSKNLFLDGTAEFNGTSELTPMDQGAQALIVEDGGKTRFVTLPVDKSSNNVLEKIFTVDLSGKEPVTNGKIVATGANAVYFRSSLEDKKRRNEIFEKYLARTYPGAKLIKATYSDFKALEKPVEITFSFKGGQLARQSANRQFIYPLGYRRNLIGAYASQSKRHQALKIRVPFASKAKISYRLPKDKAWAAAPADTKLKSKFGYMNITYKRDGDALVVAVDYGIDVQQIPASEYKAFRTFITQMNSALNATTEIKPEK